MPLRTALAKSLNVATIKVAETVGYDKVVNLAHRAGISEDVKATPAMAIGSYDATPLEMAGDYTVFANKGVRVQPTFISLVKQPNGRYEPKVLKTVCAYANPSTISRRVSTAATG